MQPIRWCYYPQFETLFGSDLAFPFVAALWHRTPNPHQVQRTRKSTVEAILKEHHSRRFEAQEVLSHLLTEPLPVSTETAALAQEHKTKLWHQLTLVGQQLQELEQQLTATLENPKTYSSTRGEQSRCRKPQKPSDRDILASIPGVAPVTKRSGKSCRVQRRRAANPRLADSMYHWARVASQHDAICRQRYQALRTRGHTHGRALRSVADRLLSSACALLKTGTLYQRTAIET